MKPPPFDLYAPATVDETLDLLADVEGARLLAGGQSLVQAMKLRNDRPDVLVDMNKLDELATLERHDGGLRIGALVRQQRLLGDADVAASWPLISQAAGFIGHRATRNRGTVGGSIAYAAPWAELTAAAIALDATIEIRSRRGERSVAARQFFTGPYATTLERDELIVAVDVPTPAPRSGSGFHEVAARYRDYAHVAAAAVVNCDDDGVCAGAELVLLRVAEAPYRTDLGAIVRGKRIDEQVLDDVADALADLDPPDGIEVTGTHRRRVGIALARRALRDAAEGSRS